MEDGRGKAVCGQEALDLLNCVTQSPFDQEKCVRLLNSLRECVLNKKVKKFSLADQEQKDAKPIDKKA
ncbi:hypothetical protein CerSpe_181590 [Prunus speciosa]|uniref:CHCH domain-containing protein n=3 Tax=Prunus TaxID=3754 RepID=A0A6J5XDF7_PRUAR|nr:hypothetical protein L3X38_028514 [Prunus dulcis]ONI07342.1 hypothetical protein PRUPE_5G114300 [Prunus persica]CAB4280084.1 unnamed protein product [Prunus armeniaca]CAB4310503.1 unnamed protein product [Prunus armeniaca]